MGADRRRAQVGQVQACETPTQASVEEGGSYTKSSLTHQLSVAMTAESGAAGSTRGPGLYSFSFDSSRQPTSRCHTPPTWDVVDLPAAVVLQGSAAAAAAVFGAAHPHEAAGHGQLGRLGEVGQHALSGVGQASLQGRLRLRRLSTKTPLSHRDNTGKQQGVRLPGGGRGAAAGCRAWRRWRPWGRSWGRAPPAAAAAARSPDKDTRQRSAHTGAHGC